MEEARVKKVNEEDDGKKVTFEFTGQIDDAGIRSCLEAQGVPEDSLKWEIDGDKVTFIRLEPMGLNASPMSIMVCAIGKGLEAAVSASSAND